MLRIEDTDRERSTPENVEQIFEALRWLELDWDGDPVFQSQRADRHAEAVERLLADGHAYRSTAGPDDVRAYKEAHGHRGFRGADEGTGAVRLRVPDEGTTTVVDVVRGETAFENALQDDLVIARADGTPVYHLAVVVDDPDAGITHVVRGADHYSNTPKHVLIQQALGFDTPVYAHLPLLHGPDGKKLSKRHGAASVQELRDGGYLPEAVRNYLALLGWGYDEETEFFTTEELQRHFSLERVSKSPAVFEEQKLRWMNGRYVRELAVDDLTARLEALTGRHRAARRRRRHAGEDLRRSTSSGRWRARSSTTPSTTRRRGRSSCSRKRARRRSPRCAARSPTCRPRGRPERVEPALRDAVERSGMKAKQVFQPLRVALDGHDDLARVSSRPSPWWAATAPWRGSTPRSRSAATPDTPQDRGWSAQLSHRRMPIGEGGRTEAPDHDPPGSPPSVR